MPVKFFHIIFLIKDISNSFMPFKKNIKRNPFYWPLTLCHCPPTFQSPCRRSNVIRKPGDCQNSVMSAEQGWQEDSSPGLGGVETRAWEQQAPCTCPHPRGWWGTWEEERTPLGARWKHQQPHANSFEMADETALLIVEEEGWVRKGDCVTFQIPKLASPS